MALKVYKPTTPGRRGMTAIQGEKPVSYTHLDVYKRQTYSMEFDRYDQVPRQIAEAITAKHRGE